MNWRRTLSEGKKCARFVTSIIMATAYAPSEVYARTRAAPPVEHQPPAGYGKKEGGWQWQSDSRWGLHSASESGRISRRGISKRIQQHSVKIDSPIPTKETNSQVGGAKKLEFCHNNGFLVSTFEHCVSNDKLPPASGALRQDPRKRSRSEPRGHRQHACSAPPSKILTLCTVMDPGKIIADPCGSAKTPISFGGYIFDPRQRATTRQHPPKTNITATLHTQPHPK